MLRVKNGIYFSRHESIELGGGILCCQFKFCHQDIVASKFKRWLNSILILSVFLLEYSTNKNLNKFLIIEISGDCYSILVNLKKCLAVKSKL